MKRRDLFSKIAAVAAAVSLAPAVKVAEAPPRVGGSLTVPSNATLSKGIVLGPTGGFDSRPEIRIGTLPYVTLINQGEQYYEAPTFEAMQADCAARGCELKLHAPDDGWQLLTHYPEGVHTQANLEYAGGIDVVYKRVAAWRASLHAEDA